MNKEQQQIIDDAYEYYLKNGQQEADRNKDYQSFLPLPKDWFINKCKTDSEFSERWGLKIEERELTEKERMVLSGYDYENRGGIGWNILKDKVDIDNSIPRKLITITYNNETIEIYE